MNDEELIVVVLALVMAFSVMFFAVALYLIDLYDKRRRQKIIEKHMQDILANRNR